MSEFDDNHGHFREGLELVRQLWRRRETSAFRIRAHTILSGVRITPKPVQKPIPTYVASFSKPSIDSRPG